MNSERLNFSDFISELTAAVYGKLLWPRLEVLKTDAKGFGEEASVMVMLWMEALGDSEILQIEKIVLDLRQDYSNVVDSVHLRAKSVAVLCKLHV